MRGLVLWQFETSNKHFPCAFSHHSFIEKFGTHIITSTAIGGRDVVYIKQHQSSPLSASDMKTYVEDIAKNRFLNMENQPWPCPISYKEKV